MHGESTRASARTDPLPTTAAARRMANRWT